MTVATSTQAESLHTPPDWVPVGRRFLGMDRRTLLPAAIVLILLAGCVWVLPAISSHVSVDDPIVAGDTVQVGDRVAFAPAPG